ncbi:MAG: glycosyltransferase family 4 protein [Armatimonadetes bacterium]|nr:glycosyltransferase family 4 protein [Armatimonadota bacterium]MDE2206485.1 glycosyltransferase family 4 protein [Armatimonadota bacterium]
MSAFERLPDAPAVLRAPIPEIRRIGIGSALLHRAVDGTAYIRSLAAAASADLIHIQHQYFLFGGVSPLRSHIGAVYGAARKPLVVTAHEVVSPTGSKLRRLALTVANRRNFCHHKIRAIVVHTLLDRTRLESIGVEPSRLHVMRHPVPEPQPLPDRAAGRERFGLTNEHTVTIFGFVTARKGHNLALDMLPLLPPDVDLLFAGGDHPDDHTDTGAKLRARILAEGMSARVHITGYLQPSDVPFAMAATDVAIAPYVEMSGSGSLASLIAYRRPILASNIPPHREIAADGDPCVALAALDSTPRFAEELRELIGSPARRAGLTAACASYADRNSYAAMASRLAALYAQIVAASPRRQRASLQ